MIVLSLFDGMACGLEALKRAGVNVTKYYASEIDKHAIQIAMKNHPDIIQLGDVEGWKDWIIDTPDLIIGGSPCQGFSFAGKQLAFDDPRSKLFFTMMDIIEEFKPKFRLLENVNMKREYLDVITQYMGVDPHFINSSLVSAQNRNRNYWHNWSSGTPRDKNILWGDVRQRGVDGFFYSQKGLNWLLRHSATRKKILKIHKDSEKMQMVEASHYKNYSSQRFFGIIDGEDNGLRYITPIECERLQTLPDNYTEGVSNTQRYKMLGNGWTVDVLAHLFKAMDD